MPSFDCESVNESSLKHPNIGELDKTVSNTSFTQSNFKRRKHETSLSKLLEACEPQKFTELAVSRQKQNEISNWFQHKASRRQPSMLVLSGPSGCGKTAAIKLLAKENGFDVIEWITPIDQIEDENSNNYYSRLTKVLIKLLNYIFKQFLIIFRTCDAARRQIRGSSNSCNALSHSTQQLLQTVTSRQGSSKCLLRRSQGFLYTHRVRACTLR